MHINTQHKHLDNYLFHLTADPDHPRRNLMYPYDKSDFLSLTSTKSFHDQPLPFRLPFSGFAFNYIWVRLSLEKFVPKLFFSIDP